MPGRSTDKINYPTNITKPSAFAVLLNAIEEKGVVKSSYASKTLFPNARAAVSRFNPENNDTHGEGTLKTYGLIDYVSDERDASFKVSYLGKRLLEVFEKDENGKFILKPNCEYTYNSVLIDCLMYWSDSTGEKTIYPGALLLMLLSDKRINEYITDYEWSYICEESDYRNTNDYEKIICDILEFRKTNEPSNLKNGYVFLVAFSASWGLLNRESAGKQNRFVLNDITKENLKCRLSQIQNTILNSCVVVPSANGGPLSVEWFQGKAKEYQNLDSEARDALEKFYERFSPEKLEALTGKDIINTIFLNADNPENLCCIMEYDAKNRELFGSIAGGNAHKYGLFFSSEGYWMTGTGRNPKKITEEEAIKIGTKMRDCLLAGVRAIKEYGALETIDDYKILHSTLKEATEGHVERAWFMKYFYMIFPDLLASDYSDAAQRTVLSAIGIEQETYPFVRMGQIKLFTDKCGISNVMFNKIFWENYSVVSNSEAVSPEHSVISVYAKPIRDDLSVEELGEILVKMYNSASNKPAGIHMFGIKYGKVIEDNNYPITSIVTASGLPTSYKEEVRKGIKIYDSIFNNEFDMCFSDESVCVEERNNCDEKKDAGFVLAQLPRNTRRTHPFNQILYGAPGTGKTYSTAQYALSIIEDVPLDKISKQPRKETMKRYNELIEDKRLVFTTFHQNYGYEDFIQGIRPDTTKGGMNFKTVDGVFKKISWEAMQNPEKDYVIIIDEINRANISKVFGELITLIEDDKRWGEENAISVILPSGEPFAVPNNLYILGTMNSADKSISLIDTALRRRFEFVEFEPNLNLITDEKLRSVLEKLNIGLSDELNSSDLLVGHSYFINKTIDDICDIMNHSIIPLLYEYFFDKSNKVEAHLKTSLEGLDIEILSASMGRIKIKKKDEQ